MFDDGIQLHSEIRDEHMRGEVKMARPRNKNAICTDTDKYFRGSIIEAVDAACEGQRRMDEIPVVL